MGSFNARQTPLFKGGRDVGTVCGHLRGRMLLARLGVSNMHTFFGRRLWRLAPQMLTGLALVASANAQEPLTTRCESAPIMAQATVLSDTGRMPPELLRFLQDEHLQQMAPYQAFDNVYYVGIC